MLVPHSRAHTLQAIVMFYESFRLLMDREACVTGDLVCHTRRNQVPNEVEYIHTC
jgi:hypothetical protein